MNILIVEDEPGLRAALVDLLQGAGHTVEAVADGAAGLAQGQQTAFDLVLLDLMLPKMSGVEVARRLRALRPGLYILMLTAKGSEQDKVDGLQAGADDYVTKPFGARELLARVEALGRRARTAQGADPDLLSADGCSFDLGRCTARRDGRTVPLTAREVAILRWLYQHRARSVSRAELLQEVWGTPGDLQTRTVDMTIANLRQKIERDPKQPRIVVTVKGVGYAFGPAA